MPMRVLHVDDDEAVASTVAEHLEREDGDVEVVTETSAAAGLDRLATTEVDCVVSAYRMPDADGLEFLDAVRAEYPTLPFVLFTDEGSETVAAEALSSGATDYLRKSPPAEQSALLAERVSEAVADARVERERRRAKRAIAASNEGISLLDEEGRFVYVNETYADIYGYEQEELLGEHWEMLYPDGEVSTVYDAALPAVEERGEWRGETRGKRKDGTVFVEDHSLAATGDGGLVCTVSDVTDRKQRQRRIEALHEATRRLMTAESRTEVAELTAEAAKNTLDYRFSVVRLLDDDGRLAPVSITDEMQSTLGGERPAYEVGEETAGRAFADGETLVYEDVSRLDDDVDRGRVRGVMYVPLGEYGVVTIADARPDAFDQSDISLAEILMANAESAMDRIEHERALERKNERLEQLAAVVSHDLTSPLNVAQGRLELLQEEYDGEHVDPAVAAVERSLTLVDDLLTLARRGADVSDVEAVDLAAEVAASWRNVETPDASLVVETERGVRADPSRLGQLLENLMRNAVEHGGEDVTVTVGDCDGGFYVADDGPGIPDGERDRVFDPGYTTSADGTGIGLNIVREIVEAHGWEIRATESDAGGARFEITGVEFAA
ncbi:MAG: ATP-binding protein [Haloferacaceae archaeon]